MQKITPCLWLNGNAMEVAQYYLSIFKNSKMIDELPATGDAPYEPGSVIVVNIEIEGHRMMLLNGGPEFQITPAISFLVECEDQAEVDYYWDRLLDGGSSMACGWLTDKFGVAWQIEPKILAELLQDPDREKAGRVMNAMMNMVKIDVAELQRAAAG